MMKEVRLYAQKFIDRGKVGDILSKIFPYLDCVFDAFLEPTNNRAIQKLIFCVPEVELNPLRYVRQNVIKYNNA